MDTITFYITMTDPVRADRRMAFRISRSAFREAVIPLPSCREFIPADAARAHEMDRERQQLTNMLARHFASAFAKLLAAEDTVNGYAPEDLPDLHDLPVLKKHNQPPTFPYPKSL